MRLKRKAKAGRRRLLRVAVIVLTAAAVIAVVLLLFQIRKIEVVGNEYISDQVIADWIQEGDYTSNALYVWAKYKFTDPKMHPNLEAVEVRLKNPWTLKIRVYEKTMVGFVYYGEDFVYFGRDGVVLAIDMEYREGVSFIEGLEVTGAELYQELPVADERIFDALLETTQMLDKSKLEADRIVCRDGQIYLYIGSVCAQIGTTNLEERIMQLPPILEKVEGKSGTLHLENYQDASNMISFEENVLPEEPQTEGDEANQDENSEINSDENTEDVQSE